MRIALHTRHKFGLIILANPNSLTAEIVETMITKQRNGEFEGVKKPEQNEKIIRIVCCAGGRDLRLRAQR